MSITIQVILLTATTIYNAIVSFLEDKQLPPGKLINVGTHKIQTGLNVHSVVPNIGLP